MKLKRIPELFRTNGYDYKLLKRAQHTAIYEQLDKGIVIHHETHKLKIMKSAIIKLHNHDGTNRVVKIPRREVLATNSNFGYFGWSFETLKDAERCFNLLNQGYTAQQLTDEYLERSSKIKIKPGEYY